jgi:hypothetical protein
MPASFYFIQGVRMNARKSFATALVASASVWALLPIGCGGGSSRDVDPKGEGAHIAEAAGAVSSFISENKGKVPTSTDDIKDWAAKKGIDAEKLVSTRDHEPYAVYQVNMGGMGKQIVLTEKTGVKGKKFAFSSANPSRLGSESTDEQIQTMIKGTGPMTGPPGR